MTSTQAKDANAANTAKDQKTGLLKKYLDNTFGEEGLRTDVKITLTNETIFKFVAAVVAASLLGTMANILVRKIFA
ncbi:MAG: hypothetical protein JST26_05510 [Bacteroidetes bacterium]|nr:hypothetical protein [Bacteroidota bacterium]